jgi:hypothetical protein
MASSGKLRLVPGPRACTAAQSYALAAAEAALAVSWARGRAAAVVAALARAVDAALVCGRGLPGSPCGWWWREERWPAPL